ncbi:tetratricopeptide repeat-containing protein [Cardiosporidium cionae]|uniref:Tetratricopeptide repeat-containing protein n=1 Tax=Cardiosporidium cionae TaxID=476202 RepID=A0ABQ7J5I8_9APIC|nr:tetratricopeptide repeat-containing protein [Cardiosporidium cionae]|eukprot:KAF8819194.1 tetratricopeptide repeat-containing protein [Cardiosporidium cionae]
MTLELDTSSTSSRLSSTMEDSIDDTEETLSIENPEASAETGSASLEEALQLKESGNAEFSQGHHEAAKIFYLKSMRIGKRLPKSESDALLKALCLNLAQTYIHLSLWTKAVNSAASALRYDSLNVKALYRRGYAYRMTKQWKEAKEDFMEILKVDPTNSKAKQELALLRKDVQTQKEEMRMGFNGFYGKNLGLYDDREKKMAAERKKEDERLRVNWKTQMDSRKEKGEEEISFEEWKESVDATASENSKKEEKTQEAPKLPDPTPLRPKSNVAEIQVDDEEEQKIVEETKRMGYCYFRRELTKDEKRLNELNRPQRLPTPLDSASPQISTQAPTPVSVNPATPSPISDWNVGGTTYEEKDVTQWAQEQFTKKIMAIKASLVPEDLSKDPSQLVNLLSDCTTQMEKDGDLQSNSWDPLLKLTSKFAKLTLKVKNVTGLAGEAHMSVVRGKRRFFFELSCGVEFAIELDPKFLFNIPNNEKTDKDLVHYSGELKLMEVSNLSSDSPDWLKDSRICFNETLLEQHRPSIDKLMELFKQEVRSSVDTFLKDFQQL